VTLFLLFLQVVGTGAPTLESAQIDITVGGDSAAVTARYSIASAADSVVFHSLRGEGQTLELHSAAANMVLEKHPGLWRLSVRTPYLSDADLTLSYVVRGTSRHVPVFVPDAPTDGKPGGVTVRVGGLPPGARLRDGFPRLAADAQGEMTASLANVPSVVRLPHVDGGVTVDEAADAVVVVLLLGGSVVWWTYSRARRRRGAA
jgi:hypothetical protein